MHTLDGYEQFFQIIPKEKFFEFGLNNIITIEESLVNSEWRELLGRIERRTQDLYVRDSGRNGRGNDYLSQLYLDVFGIRINYDPTNNNQPSALIQKLTGHRKNKTIFNYQVSHVFGRTKNVFCFTAPWNIVFVPKIVDPFTGHEAKGNSVREFTTLFQCAIVAKFGSEIDDFNQNMRRINREIEQWLELVVPEKDREKYLKEFEEIRT